jgi:hypothetical protein
MDSVDAPWPDLPDEVIPSSWWMYFATEASAQACAYALGDLECLTLVEHRLDIPHRPEKWLVRASKPVADEELASFCAEIKAVTQRHGGIYEGWDSGWVRGDQLATLVQRSSR